MRAQRGWARGTGARGFRTAAVCVLGAGLWCGCGPEEREDGSDTQMGGGGAAAGGGSGEAGSGVVPEGCAPGEVTLAGGACRPAGVPPEACAGGFEADGTMGCIAIVPKEPCGPGKMAVPGEAACRDVAPCGEPPWGTIPDEPGTQYVDASYAGGESDGSPEKPWTTIAAALVASKAGTIVAIAAGTYGETLDIGKPTGGPRRLWGRCPGLVTIAGAPGKGWAVRVQLDGGGTELRDLGISGASTGVAAVESGDVLLDRVWIHDTGTRGVEVTQLKEPTNVLVRGSLVEDPGFLGLATFGAGLVVESSVVRGVAPGGGQPGVAVAAIPQGGAPAKVAVRGSVLENNRTIGVHAESSDATVEATLVRDTEADGDDGPVGEAISVATRAGGVRARLWVRGSVLKRSRRVGLVTSGADATVETTVVRDTRPSAEDDSLGVGMSFADGSAVTLRDVVIERSRSIGLSVAASDITVDGALVRDTEPSAADQTVGWGVSVIGLAQHATATLRGSRVAKSREIGIGVVDADVTLERVLVEDTLLQEAGAGMVGDGVLVASYLGAASTTLLASRVERSARAGLTMFGAGAKVGTTSFECNPIHIDGESGGATPFAFDNLGGNACGCGPDSVTCRVLSSGLLPPSLDGD